MPELNFLGDLLGGFSQGYASILLQDRQQEFKRQQQQQEVVARLLESENYDVLPYLDKNVLKNAGITPEAMQGLLGVQSIKKQVQQAQIQHLGAQTKQANAKAEAETMATDALKKLPLEKQQMAQFPALANAELGQATLQQRQKEFTENNIIDNKKLQLVAAEERRKADEFEKDLQLRQQALQQQIANQGQTQANERERINLERQGQQLQKTRIENEAAYHNASLASLDADRKERLAQRDESRISRVQSAAGQRFQGLFDELRKVDASQPKDKKTGKPLGFDTQDAAQAHADQLNAVAAPMYEAGVKADLIDPSRPPLKYEPYVAGTNWFQQPNKFGVREVSQAQNQQQQGGPEFEKWLAPAGNSGATSTTGEAGPPLRKTQPGSGSTVPDTEETGPRSNTNPGSTSTQSGGIQFTIPRDANTVARMEKGIADAKAASSNEGGPGQNGNAIRILTQAGFSREVAAEIVNKNLYEMMDQTIQTEKALRRGKRR